MGKNPKNLKFNFHCYSFDALMSLDDIKGYIDSSDNKGMLAEYPYQIYNSAKSVTNSHPELFEDVDDALYDEKYQDLEGKDPKGVIHDDLDLRAMKVDVDASERNKQRIPDNKKMNVRIKYEEIDLRSKIKSFGGVWNKEKKTWELSYKLVKYLRLTDRIVS